MKPTKFRSENIRSEASCSPRPASASPRQGPFTAPNKTSFIAGANNIY